MSLHGSASDTCFKGEVINPWTDDFSKPLTPGGSSGGSAAVVAASGHVFSRYRYRRTNKTTCFFLWKCRP